ncbi:MAG: tetratricopeptide repeat protein [Pseudomonadota bacterium]
MRFLRRVIIAAIAGVIGLSGVAHAEPEFQAERVREEILSKVDEIIISPWVRGVELAEMARGRTLEARFMAGEDVYAAELLLKGKFAEARDQLEVLVEYYPEDPRVLLNLAYAYVRLGEVEEARTYYNEVLALRGNGLTYSSPDKAVRSKQLARLALKKLLPEQ